jgi:hypothetical protein
MNATTTKENASIVSAGENGNTQQGESELKTERNHYTPSESEKKLIQFTVFSSPKLLTKHIQIGETGKLEKTNPSSFVNLAEKKQCGSLAQVMGILDALTDNQAAGWGVYALGDERVALTTKDNLVEGQAARSKEFFSWPNAAGVLMIDIDQPHDPLDAYNAICRAYEEATGHSIADVEFWYRPSASAGACIPGDPPLEGGRLYAAVANGSQIPAIGAAIFAGLWLTGYGHIFVSKAGTALPRALVDATVWSPERLDFVRPALLGPGIERQARKAYQIGGIAGRMLAGPSSTIPAGVVPADKLAAQKDTIARAIEKASPEIEAARAAFCEARDALNGTGCTVQDAVKYQSLTAKFTVELAKGEMVSIGTILARPEKYHKVLCCDPLEPVDERGNSTYGKAIIFTNKRPIIKSFLHGGATYRLSLRTRVDEPSLPTNPADRVKAIARQLRVHFKDEVFLSMDRLTPQLKRIDNDGRPTVFSKSQFAIVLSDRIQQHADKLQGKKENATWVTEKTILSGDAVNDFYAMLGTEYVDLPRLKSGTNKPYLVPSTGIFVTEPGYDPATKIYLSVEHAFPPLQQLTDLTRAATIEQLLAPFNGFSFIAPNDAVDSKQYTKAIALGCVLYAAVRRTVAGPILMPSGGRAGIGKTEFSRILVHGMGCNLVSTKHERTNDEENKKVWATLVQNPPEYVCLDNADGNFNHTTIEGLVDKQISEAFELRLLGTNTSIDCFNDMLVIVNGINTRPASEAMARRCLRIEFEQIAMWQKEITTFNSPSAYVKANWEIRHMQCLSLLADYASRGFPRNDLPMDFPSVPDFDKWIRGFIYEQFGVDVKIAITEEATDIADRNEVDGAVGQALTVCWMYAICKATPNNKEWGYDAFSLLAAQNAGSSVTFTMTEVKHWIKTMRLDPNNVLQKTLANPRGLKNAKKVNGLSLMQATKKGENQTATWSVAGSPLEISTWLLA